MSAFLAELDTMIAKAKEWHACQLTEIATLGSGWGIELRVYEPTYWARIQAKRKAADADGDDTEFPPDESAT